MPATIETEDLTRAFGSERALEGVTFRVEPGEVVALLGPNGAGKTTTIRLLNGILRPDRGRIRVLGIDPSVDGDAVRRRTGVLSEGSGLDERLTALENVTFAARIRGIERGAAERTASDLLARFGMSDRAGHAVRGFSTGQRKRVALARALLHDPEVLFLDEPTSGLDPEATRDVLDLLATMAREHGRTVVVCTHFLAEAGRLADRLAMLHHGRLHAFGRLEEIAAGLWDDLGVDLELGAPADGATLAVVRSVRGVREASSTPSGARLRVDDRTVVPAIVASLVGREVAVYAAVPHPPSLEDVYFALEARAEREERAH